MKKMKCSHLGKKMATLAIALVMILSCSFSAMAAPRSTGVYLGAGVVNLGDGIVNYQINGHVYYNANTSTYLNLASLAQWIYNYGSQVIDEVSFYASNGACTNITDTGYYDITPITAGNAARIEHSYFVNPVFQKDGPTQLACTSIKAGFYGGISNGAWDSSWYPTTRSDSFNHNCS